MKKRKGKKQERVVSGDIYQRADESRSAHRYPGRFLLFHPVVIANHSPGYFDVITRPPLGKR